LEAECKPNELGRNYMLRRLLVIFWRVLSTASVLLIALLIAVLWLYTKNEHWFKQQATAGDRGDLIGVLFSGCSDPCVVNYNLGGVADNYIHAAQIVNSGARKQVIIDGDCISACAIFADLARKRVCITQRARFGFHKAAYKLYPNQAADAGVVVNPETQYTDPPRHSADIIQWVKKRGDFPKEGLLWMDAKEAEQFWGRCDFQKMAR
jgi:hypothetical protein